MAPKSSGRTIHKRRRAGRFPCRSGLNPRRRPAFRAAVDAASGKSLNSLAPDDRAERTAELLGRLDQRAVAQREEGKLMAFMFADMLPGASIPAKNPENLVRDTMRAMGYDIRDVLGQRYQNSIKRPDRN